MMRALCFMTSIALGTLLDARPLIGEVVDARRRELEKSGGRSREIRMGRNPAILYFTGQHEILSCDTVLGKVHARHHIKNNLGGPVAYIVEE